MTPSNGNVFRVTALCEGNTPVTGWFPSQKLVTRSFDVCFDLRLNKRLSRQLRRWWFETPSRWSLWRDRYEVLQMLFVRIIHRPASSMKMRIFGHNSQRYQSQTKYNHTWGPRKSLDIYTSLSATCVHDQANFWVILHLAKKQHNLKRQRKPTLLSESGFPDSLPKKYDGLVWPSRSVLQRQQTEECVHPHRKYYRNFPFIRTPFY